MKAVNCSFYQENGLLLRDERSIAFVLLLTYLCVRTGRGDFVHLVSMYHHKALYLADAPL